MNNPDRKFWPFRPQTSIALSLALLLGLLFILTVLKRADEWQISEDSDTAVLIGVVLFSLLPILLALVDIIIERGGVIEYGGMKIDFSQVPQTGISGFTVPVNIGVPGQTVSDSSTTEILDSLRQATACEVVIIDLEEGEAWWETRLLVLLAGAVRLNRPRKVVFVSKDGGINECFQGWGHPYKLLRRLLQAHPQYLRSFHVAQAAARQWELVEPVNPVNPANPGAAPLQPGWIQAGLAMQHPGMAFDGVSGLPNDLLAEQLLASDLGEKVENKETPRVISLDRLGELFWKVLHTESIDESWTTEKQMNTFFESDSEYIAVTKKRKYTTLVSRLTVLNTMVKTLVEKKPKA